MSAPSIDEIAARIPAHVAQLAVAKAFAQVGSEREWDAGTIERVMFHLDAALPYLGLKNPDSDGDIPSPYSLTVTDGLFWAERLAEQ